MLLQQGPADPDVVLDALQTPHSVASQVDMSLYEDTLEISMPTSPPQAVHKQLAAAEWIGLREKAQRALQRTLSFGNARRSRKKHTGKGAAECKQAVGITDVASELGNVSPRDDAKPVKARPFSSRGWCTAGAVTATIMLLACCSLQPGLHLEIAPASQDQVHVAMDINEQHHPDEFQSLCWHYDHDGDGGLHQQELSMYLEDLQVNPGDYVALFNELGPDPGYALDCADVPDWAQEVLLGLEQGP